MGAEERLYLDALMEAGRPGELPGRSGVLARARIRRRPVVEGPAWTAPFAGRVAAMDALLASARPEDWSAVVVEGWNVQELVAHLAAKDGLIADLVGAPVIGPEIVARDALGRTAELQAFERTRSPEETRREWREQADALCRALGHADPELTVELDGLPVPVRDQMLGRMLETWVHTDDTAKTMGVVLPRPMPEHINPAADLCARLLPWTMVLSGMNGSGHTLELTLTGDGGGVWRVPLGVEDSSPPPPDIRITCDVVEFCFLLGGRGKPEEFAAEVAGDRGLARDILVSAPALSGP